MLVAGTFCLVGDTEQSEDWVIVDVDGQSWVFVRQSALERDPAAMTFAVLEQVLAKHKPPPAGARRAVA